MYRTCIFCSSALGSNEAIEEFQVGDRLAFEMVLHEESERRALEGELAALEAAWREAEEIAAIADALPDDPLEGMDPAWRGNPDE